MPKVDPPFTPRKVAQHKQFSPKVSKKDTSDNVISYDTLKEYMETNGYEDYESPIKILDDVELWKDPQNESPEVLIISDANALMVRKDKEMIVYTPSKVFEAFMLSGASCMIFLRDDRELRYKGTFKASPLQAIDQAHYQTFSEPDKRKIVEMSMRLKSKKWSWQTEQALREGVQVLNGYRLDYVGWEKDMQEALDVLDRQYRSFFYYTRKNQRPNIEYRRTYLKTKGKPIVESDGDTTDEDMLPVCQMPESPIKHVAAAKEKAGKEQAAKEKAAKRKVAKERAAKEKQEAKSAEKEKAEMEIAERERDERERAERDRTERDRIERDRTERGRIEREKAEKEKAERAKAESAEMEWEQAESDRAEREQTEDPDEEMVAWVRPMPRTLMSQVLDR
ncbi:hypothetical protein EIP86_001928 [Pleurotus ostreatoroseus]|nr:hypothetical protein EIP86_001928 [Pleurotus ostreatoroseus]